MHEPFFGLVNQVQWAYANGKEMQPFRDLVKPNSCFQWTDELESLFEECKSRIIHQVSKGVKKYDIQRATCLQTDFSKEGLGYLLLQKYCNCSVEDAPLCCKEGWELVFAGSRFTKGAEANYAPTEGEALAVAWGLNHAHIFTKGCPKLIIATDHEPLLGILNNKPMEAIRNPRLLRLKEHTLQFNFTIKYTRGKWNRAPDALSRYPDFKSAQTEVMQIFCDGSDEEEFIDFAAEIAAADLIQESSITFEDVCEATKTDPELQWLASAINNGFSETHHSTDPEIRKYFNIRDELWVQDEVVMFRNRIVVPKRLRCQILRMLHSAHQGVEGMRSRASESVYWPGLTSAIKQIRNNCMFCNKVAPSQARQTLQLIPAPEFPFQHVCIDAFEMHGRHYLVAVDRYSGWLVVFFFRQHPQSKHMVESLRSLFSVYGAPENLFSDGGLPFQSQEFKQFIMRWKIKHTTSSALYPQGNGRAELAVKTAKRILTENVAADGSLNTDQVCRALLQYRNTPIQHLGLSPAQILFHRNLRDGLPTDPRALRPHTRWIEAACNREEAYRKRNIALTGRYNRTTRNLAELPPGTTVLVQDQHVGNRRRWNKSGTIVEANNRQYDVRMDGSGRIVSRNRRFIKPIQNHIASEVRSELINPSQHLQEAGVQHDNIPSGSPPTPPRLEGEDQDSHSTSNVTTATTSRLPRALTGLFPHNKPGLKEM